MSTDSNYYSDDSAASDDSFDNIGPCAKCNNEGELCPHVVTHVGENTSRLLRSNRFNLELDGKDLINNVLGEVRKDREHNNRLKAQDMSACLLGWRDAVDDVEENSDEDDAEANDEGDGGNEDNGEDGDSHDDNQQILGSFASGRIPGAVDAMEESAHAHRVETLASFLRDANETFPDLGNMFIDQNESHPFSDSVYDRVKAIEAARMICLRATREPDYDEENSAHDIKARIKNYLERDLVQIPSPSDMASLLYSMYFDPKKANHVVVAYKDNDLVTAYRIFKTQGEDETEIEKYLLDNINENDDGNESDYDSEDEHRYENTETDFEALAAEVNWDEIEADDEDSVEVEESVSGNRRGRNDENGNQDTRGRRRSRRIN